MGCSSSSGPVLLPWDLGRLYQIVIIRLKVATKIWKLPPFSVQCKYACKHIRISCECMQKYFTYTSTYTYIYIYIYREREREITHVTKTKKYMYIYIFINYHPSLHHHIRHRGPAFETWQASQSRLLLMQPHQTFQNFPAGSAPEQAAWNDMIPLIHGCLRSTTSKAL